MVLQSIWFFLWGLLWAGYFALDGFDLGMGMLTPFLAKNDTEKRIMLNAAGPFWDGNEVWLISAGGVTFAAFPIVYASLFSGLYLPLMLLLFALIVRGVAFEFRSKHDSPAWRKLWDVMHLVGSFLPALLLGVTFANIFMGLQVDAQGYVRNSFFSLLNPYGLAGGVFFVIMFCMHGAIWLALKTQGDLHERAMSLAGKLWLTFAVLLVAFLGLSAVYTKLFTNYLVNPVLFAVPLLVVGTLLATRSMLAARKLWLAWAASALTIVGVTFFGIIGLFPAMLPSSLNPAWSLTAHNASSSQLTLKIMLGVVLIFVPLVLLYQGWVYKRFSHKITEEDLAYEESY